MTAQFLWPPITRASDPFHSESYQYYSEMNGAWYTPLYSSALPTYVFCEQIYDAFVGHKVIWNIRDIAYGDLRFFSNSGRDMTGPAGLYVNSTNGISLYGGSDTAFYGGAAPNTGDVYHADTSGFSISPAVWSTVKSQAGTYRGLLSTPNGASPASYLYATTEVLDAGSARGIVAGSNTTYFCFFQKSSKIYYIKYDLTSHPYAISASAQLISGTANTDLWFILDAGEGYYYLIYRVSGSYLAIRGMDCTGATPTLTGVLGGSGASPWTDHTPLKCGTRKYINYGSGRLLTVQTASSTITISFTTGTKATPTITRTARSVPFAATHFVVEADPAQTSIAYVVALGATYAGGSNPIVFTGAYAPLHNLATAFSSSATLASGSPTTDTLRSFSFSSAAQGESVHTVGVAAHSYSTTSANTFYTAWNFWHTPINYTRAVGPTSSAYSSASVGKKVNHLRGVTSNSAYSSSIVGFISPGHHADDFRWTITNSNQIVSGVTATSTYSSATVGGLIYHPIDTLPLQQSWTNVGYTYMDAFMVYVNQDRAALGLPPYKTFGADGLFTTRADIANYHATQMAFNRIYAHEDTGFNQNWKTISERANNAPSTSIAENIQNNTIRDVEAGTEYGFYTAYSLWNNWHNSPVHYGNITYNWGAKNTSVYSMLGVAEGWYPLALGPSAYWAKMGYYCNNFVLLETLVIESTLNQFWDNAGALSTVLEQRWSNDSWVTVRAQHFSPYSLELGLVYQHPYGCEAAVEYLFPLTYGVATEFSFPYAGDSTPIVYEYSFPYEIKNTNSVAAQAYLPYGIEVSTAYDAPYSISTDVRAEFSFEYAIKSTTDVYMEHQAPYAADVSSSLYAPYSIGGVVSSEWYLPYSTIVAVAAEHYAPYSTLSVNSVDVEYTFYYSAQDLSPISITSNSVTMTLPSGLVIPIDDGVLDSADSEVGYFFECAIIDLAVYAQIHEGDHVVVDFCGEIYNLVISSKSLSREDGSVTFRVKADNQVVRMDAPYSPEIDYTQDTAMLVSGIVDYLSEINFTYDIVDWTLPARKLEVSKATTLSILQQLAKAPGGVADALPDGTLWLRYRYPYPMNALGAETPDQTYTEEYDYLSVSIDTEYRDGANRFRVKDADATFGDRLEWVPDEIQATAGMLSGTLKAYLSPYRTTASIVHLGNASSVTPLGELSETLEELIEFNKGSGSTSRPIHSLTSLEWLTASLGAATFQPYSSELTSGASVNEGYGLAKVVYTSKYLAAKVTGVTATIPANTVGPPSAYGYFVLEETSG